MNENTPNQATVQENNVCKNCLSPMIEQGYHTPLCENCRTTLSKKPLPLWIKVFSVLILLLLVYAFYGFHESLMSGVHYERGRRAEQKKKYATAVREYQKVTEKHPNPTETLARLFIAHYHNGEIEEASAVYQKIEGRHVSKELVREVNATLDRMEKLYWHSDALAVIVQGMKPNDFLKSIKSLEEYLAKNPEDVMAAFYLASVMRDVKRYDDAEKVMNGVLRKNTDFYRGYFFLAALYRDKGLYDQGLEYCRKVLEHNLEDTRAYVSMSKIELKRSKDKEGLELALKAYEIDDQKAYVLSNLSLAYHFNGRMKERDEMFNLLKTKKDGGEEAELLSDIYSGRIEWR